MSGSSSNQSVPDSPSTKVQPYADRIKFVYGKGKNDAQMTSNSLELIDEVCCALQQKLLTKAAEHARACGRESIQVRDVCVACLDVVDDRDTSQLMLIYADTKLQLDMMRKRDKK